MASHADVGDQDLSGPTIGRHEGVWPTDRDIRALGQYKMAMPPADAPLRCRLHPSIHISYQRLASVGDRGSNPFHRLPPLGLTSYCAALSGSVRGTVNGAAGCTRMRLSDLHRR